MNSEWKTHFPAGTHFHGSVLELDSRNHASLTDLITLADLVAPVLARLCPASLKAPVRPHPCRASATSSESGLHSPGSARANFARWWTFVVRFYWFFVYFKLTFKRAWLARAVSVNFALTLLQLAPYQSQLPATVSKAIPCAISFRTALRSHPRVPGTLQARWLGFSAYSEVQHLRRGPKLQGRAGHHLEHSFCLLSSLRQVFERAETC